MNPKPTNNYRSFLPVIIVLAIGMILYFSFSYLGEPAKKVLSYDDLVNKIESNEAEVGKIKEIIISSYDFYAEGKMTGKDENGDFVDIYFETSIPPELVESVTEKLLEADVKVTFEAPSENFLLVLLSNIAPFILIIFFWFFMMRTMQGGGGQALTFGKSKAKLFLDDRPRISFKDVAGIPEVKEELKEVIDFLREPKKFKAMGAKVPRGVLLVGPPGCGKTYISRAVAGEAKVPFFSVSGSEFVEMFVGVGASRVRDMFEQAKRYAPALIFIDEIDAVGRQRGAGLGGGHEEREQTLNQLLVEMDGFDPNIGVIIIAATNRPDILDAALLRPGRFDRRITIDMPTQIERSAILKYHGKNKPIASDISPDVIAKRTAGFTGADLENLLNEAAIIATRRKKKEIERDDVEEAIDRVLAGPQKRTRVLSEETKRKVAYHEGGHALIMNSLGPSPVHRISIVSRGQALGYTASLPTEDRYMISKKDLLHTIAGLLGGVAAEHVVFDEITTGASDDIKKATSIAKKMVREFGMSDLGPVAFGHPSEQVFLGRELSSTPDYSEETGKKIDMAIEAIIKEARSLAESIIMSQRETLDKLVEELIVKETIDDDDLKRILGRAQ
ncbi:MAG TPA: ATP-dependent zinc metalloprotease FtsH [Caldisericia bacterium]|nr:ATP-dependent zinc metalloprotease FtsH [Caldisericia bacterium]HRV75444.1 ATP-dependent zinc metalloprotease FtsH [Caldisericia bacterium]